MGGFPRVPPSSVMLHNFMIAVSVYRYMRKYCLILLPTQILLRNVSPLTGVNMA